MLMYPPFLRASFYTVFVLHSHVQMIRFS